MQRVAVCGAFLLVALAIGSDALAFSAVGFRNALVNCLTEGVDPSQRISACNDVIHANILLPEDRARVIAARGNAHFAQGDFDKALDDYNKSVLLNAKLPPPVINRAIAYIKMGKCDQTAADFNTMLSFDAHSWRAYYGLSLCDAKMGDQAKAQADLAAATAINPNAAKQFGPQEVPRWFQ